MSWRSYIVAFTGHRVLSIESEARARKHLREVLEAVHRTYGIAYAISGMALGVDTWAAETCVELGIPFVAAVPCDGQAAAWGHEDQVRYHNLLCKAQRVQLITPGPYAAWKMQARNAWMVRHASHLIAVWNGTPGGTRNCIDVARSRIRSEAARKLEPEKRFILTHIDPRWDNAIHTEPYGVRTHNAGVPR